MSPSLPIPLTNIDRADVYKAGRLAGILDRAGDVIRFRYLPEYLADDASPPVAVTLPKSPAEVVTHGGHVPPFFAGLLPEGLRLQAAVTAARTSIDDHFTLLLVVGGDVIGDVQVLAHGEALTDPLPAFDLGHPAHLDFVDVFARAVSGDLSRMERVSLPGIQSKVSAAMFSAPLRSRQGPAILKLNPPTFPRLVENEDFFLRMARACGLKVPDHRLVTDSVGNTGLLVDRFDRFVNRREFVRLPQEDACQVMGRYPSAKYQLTLQDVARSLATTVEKLGGSAAMTLLAVLEIAAFSYLVGNGDLHAKNLSIHEPHGGTWQLTPAYDLLSSWAYLPNDPMALELLGRPSNLPRRRWLEAATYLGLPERAVALMLDRLVARSDGWARRVEEIGLDEQSTNRIERLIDSRRRELAG